MNRPWTKVYGGDLLESKRVRRMAPASRWAYVALMTGLAHDDGRVYAFKRQDGTLEPILASEIADELGLSLRTWNRALSQMLKQELITEDPGHPGVLMLPRFARKAAKQKDPESAKGGRKSGVPEAEVDSKCPESAASTPRKRRKYAGGSGTTEGLMNAPPRARTRVLESEGEVEPPNPQKLGATHPSPPSGREPSGCASLADALRGEGPLPDVGGKLLRQAVADRLQRAGWAVSTGLRVRNRGDGRAGTIALTATLGDQRIAVEVCRSQPLPKAVTKLRNVAAGVHRLVVVAGGFAALERPEGIDVLRVAIRNERDPDPGPRCGFNPAPPPPPPLSDEEHARLMEKVKATVLPWRKKAFRRSEGAA